MPQGRGTTKRSKKNGRSRRKPAAERQSVRYTGREVNWNVGSEGLYTQPPAGR